MHRVHLAVFLFPRTSQFDVCFNPVLQIWLRTCVIGITVFVRAGNYWRTARRLSYRFWSPIVVPNEYFLWRLNYQAGCCGVRFCPYKAVLYMMLRVRYIFLWIIQPSLAVKVVTILKIYNQSNVSKLEPFVEFFQSHHERPFWISRLTSQRTERVAKRSGDEAT